MNKQNLTSKFTVMFALFTIVTLIFISISSYINQTKLYNDQLEENAKSISTYLENILSSDGLDFVYYQEYFLSHTDTLKVPLTFSEYEAEESRKNFCKLFATRYPGKVLGKDIAFFELDEDIKEAFTIYKHEYYLLRFEKAREDFNLLYTEYIVPSKDKENHVIFTLDGMRDERIIDGKKYIELGITVPQPPKEHKKEWEAWNTGKRPHGYDSFNNEYGKTHAYYAPLYIHGQKIGIIGLEVEIANINKGILLATLREILIIAAVLIVCVSILLYIIRTKYIKKLLTLSNSIEEFSATKNNKIAERLFAEVTSEDEISTIIEKFADLIYELEIYINNLTKATNDLQDTKRQAYKLEELATKDSLTGIRNKTAYDKEVQKITWELESGEENFGVAMIDLNFLKRINDTFGHDKGNIAIISLCRIICKTFAHSPVFRIGGDEFAVLLKGEDFENIENLEKEFNRKLLERQNDETLEYWEKTSAALGYALYNPNIDPNYDSVFKRADSKMYKVKRAMKAVREI